MLKKILYYLPKVVLSSIYANSLKRKSVGHPHLDQKRFSVLIQTIKTQLLSPKRNGFPDLVKRAIAAYYMSPGDRAIDVGAHVGSFTALYAAIVGSTGTVYSYEAHPLIFQKLEKRFAATKQVVVKNVAVSDQSHRLIQMKIYPGEIKHECATVETALMSEERMPGNTAIIEVASEHLDALSKIPDKRPIRLVKIDVEGHEHAVISGATQMIQQHKPVLLYEYGFIPNKFEPGTIQQIEKLGYVAYDCATLKQVRPGYVALDVNDLVAVPIERVQELETLFLMLQ